MSAYVLLKHSNSKCNKDLLSYLHSKSSALKKKIKIKIVIVYSNIAPILRGKISKLPALIINGSYVTGNRKITDNLSSIIDNGPNGSDDKCSITGSSNLQDYWSSEMYSREQEGENDEDQMEKIKQKAIDQSIVHKEQLDKKPKFKKTIVSSSDDNLKMDTLTQDDISSMDDDPYMKKYWENQEGTPGVV